jgi:hypothetical protein
VGANPRHHLSHAVGIHHAFGQWAFLVSITNLLRGGGGLLRRCYEYSLCMANKTAGSGNILYAWPIERQEGFACAPMAAGRLKAMGVPLRRRGSEFAYSMPASYWDR